MAETETRNGDRSCSDSNECLVTAGDFQNQDDENVASDNEQLDVADLIEQNHLELVTNLDLERQFMFRYVFVAECMHRYISLICWSSSYSRKVKIICIYLVFFLKRNFDFKSRLMLL